MVLIIILVLDEWGKISKRGPAKKHKAEADGNAGTNRIFEVV